MLFPGCSAQGHSVDLYSHFRYHFILSTKYNEIIETFTLIMECTLAFTYFDAVQYLNSALYFSIHLHIYIYLYMNTYKYIYIRYL